MSWWLVGAAAASAVYGAYNDHKGNRQDARNGYGLAAILGSAAGGSALAGGSAAGGAGASSGGGTAAGGEAGSGLLLDTSAGGWGGAVTGDQVGAGAAGSAGSGSPAYMKLLGNALSSYGKGSQSGGAANQGSYNASGIPDLSQPAFVYNPQPDMKPYSIAPNQMPDEQDPFKQREKAMKSGLMASGGNYGY